MTDREQFAKDNCMSMDFVNWFFDHKKEVCGNVWFMMAAAMWEGWKGLASQEPKPLQVTDGMALDFHRALTDGSIGKDELEEIKIGLRTALCNYPEHSVAAVPDIVTLQRAFERSEQEGDHCAELKKSGLGYANKATQSRWEQWLSCRAAILLMPGPVSDTQRMDRLVAHYVEIRNPLRYGNEAMFAAQTITDEEDDYHSTKLREQIDAAIQAGTAKTHS